MLTPLVIILRTSKDLHQISVHKKSTFIYTRIKL